MSRSYSIMVSAGEASGDLHAALALEELHKTGLNFKSFGVGGDKLRAQGTQTLLDCSDLAVIGIFEVLMRYRELSRKLEILRDALRQRQPDLLLLVDYPDFNLKLAETAKSLGIPVLFYISPQVWAWRSGRVKRIGELVSMMAVIFPFEVAFYEGANVPVRYVGHPLVDEVGSELTPQQARRQFAVQEHQPVLAILPGSRNGEVKRVLPTLLKTVRELRQRKPDLCVLLPHARTVDSELLTDILRQFPDVEINPIKGQAYDVMQAADAVLTASGTATLETAMMGKPMAIAYRVNPLTYAIMSRMILIDSIGLVNIVAGKKIVQEFVQSKAKPGPIADEIERLLDDSDYRCQMQHELGIVKQKMGAGGGSANVAALLQEMLLATQTATPGK